MLDVAMVLAVVGCFLTALMTPRVARILAIDSPGERSSHTVDTPRGGGLVFGSCILIGLLVLGIAGVTDAFATIVVLSSLGLLFVVGLMEDFFGVSALFRLAYQAAAALGAVVGLGATILGTLPLPLAAALGAVLVLGFVWMVNLYNFMDGINGIAGLQAVVAASGLSVVLLIAGLNAQASFALIIAAVSIGFLPSNFPAAKVFMGDSGSLVLGGAFAVLWLWSGAQLPIFFLLVPLALGAFVFDATFTLLKRLIKGEKIWLPHRSHFYQQLAIKLGDHGPVAALYAGLAFIFAVLNFVFFSTFN